MIIKNIFQTMTSALFVSLFILSMNVTGVETVNAYGYDTYDGGSYNTYDYGDYGYNTYDYGDYGYNTYDYGDYGYNTYDYGDYGYNTYDYGDYGYNTYDYGDYGYNTYDYGDYGYNTYDYGDYGYNTYDYGDFGYNTYDYGDYTNYGYTDYYTPSSSSCYGTWCGGNNGGYTDYYTPSQTQCSGSNCGGGQQFPGQSRPGGGLGLNLSYQDNDTTVTNNTCSNVGGRRNGGNCNETIDNSTTTINTTTTTNCSNNSGDGNCNTTNNTVVARNDDRDEFDIICRVSDSRIEVGDTVTFSVDIDGGKRPFDIEWDGDISGDGASERVRFNRVGTYEAEVTVEDDNGRRARDTCTVRVVDEDEDEDEDDDNRNVNVVTRTNLGTPTGNLASLDSVFLSSVPYTGPKEILNALGVLAFIAIWSTAVAMYFKKRRQVRATAGRLEAFKAMNKSTATIR